MGHRDTPADVAHGGKKKQKTDGTGCGADVGSHGVCFWSVLSRKTLVQAMTDSSPQVQSLGVQMWAELAACVFEDWTRDALWPRKQLTGACLNTHVFV